MDPTKPNFVGKLKRDLERGLVDPNQTINQVVTNKIKKKKKSKMLVLSKLHDLFENGPNEKKKLLKPFNDVLLHYVIILGLIS